MSLTRRLAAGLPAAGATLFASLVIAGAPALAAEVPVPGVMAAPSADAGRGQSGYGSTAPDGYGTPDTPASPAASTTSTGSGNTAGTPTRGQTGYGGESPAPSPSVSVPTGTVQSVPPGGVSPSEMPSPSITGGVSSGGTLPLTGAPLGTLLAVGGLLVAGGAASVWYTRRRNA